MRKFVIFLDSLKLSPSNQEEAGVCLSIPMTLTPPICTALPEFQDVLCLAWESACSEDQCEKPAVLFGPFLLSRVSTVSHRVLSISDFRIPSSRPDSTRPFPLSGDPKAAFTSGQLATPSEVPAAPSDSLICYNNSQDSGGQYT